MRNMIEEKKILEIVNRIAKGYDPDKIILFGSYAKGTSDENSDLDLFVLKDTDLSKAKRVVQVRKLLYGAMIPMDLVVFTPEEVNESKDNKFSFVHEILNTGQVLYERAS